MPRAGRCPSCGSPVSAFAAGCAICGADLDAHRRRRTQPAGLGVRLPSLPRPRLSDDALAVLMSVVAAVFFPLIALVVVLLMLRNPARANVRAQLIAVGVVALLLLALPTVRYGILALAYG